MAKIMIIHHAPSIGGGSISFLDIISMLEGEHHVISSCPSKPPILHDYMIRNNYSPIDMNIPIPTYNHFNGGHSILSRTFWKGIVNIKNRKRIKKYLEFYKPDIVIVNSSVMVLLGPIIKSSGIKSICISRETFVEKFLNIRTYIMRKMMDKWFDGNIFISNYDRKHSKVESSKTEVIADCIRPNLLRKIPREKACEIIGVTKDSFNILFTGGSSWIKGLDDILEAMKILKDENIKIVIAGKIDLKKHKDITTLLRNVIFHNKSFRNSNKLRRLFNDSEISDKIKLVDVQYDMSYAYSSCDLVVFPAKIPHQSRPTIEAGFYSMPIVVPKYKQYDEYVVDGFNGLTYKPHNSIDLAHKISVLYNNHSKLVELGKNNNIMNMKLHNYLKEKHKLNRFVKKILTS